jgi:hypothetical protein
MLPSTQQIYQDPNYDSRQRLIKHKAVSSQWSTYSLFVIVGQFGKRLRLDAKTFRGALPSAIRLVDGPATLRIGLIDTSDVQHKACSRVLTTHDRG